LSTTSDEALRATLRQKLINIGAKVVRDSRQVIFQMMKKKLAELW
jgi:predicted translin family RNA/ssDNA-binding protein